MYAGCLACGVLNQASHVRGTLGQGVSHSAAGCCCRGAVCSAACCQVGGHHSGCRDDLSTASVCCGVWGSLVGWQWARCRIIRPWESRPSYLYTSFYVCCTGGACMQRASVLQCADDGTSVCACYASWRCHAHGSCWVKLAACSYDNCALSGWLRDAGMWHRSHSRTAAA
jgi:hypothetical protein